MKFSVIMPSYLGAYKHAASNRDTKIVRAIASVLTQKDFELIVIADGCDKTIEIVKANYFGEKRLRLFRIEKTRPFSGFPRNAGIQQARGEYIIYLDIDDVYMDGYLEQLSGVMEDHDWYWFDDVSFNKLTGKFDLHRCDITTQGRCGTSNVCHRLDMGAWWNEKPTYLHDWVFINSLKQISSNYKRLEVAGYGICHV